MKIGIVLASVPAYSETFFRNKILGLQNRGYQVILFTNHSKNTNFNLCKTIAAPNSKTVLGFLNQIKNIVLNPKQAVKLYKLNRADKLSIKNSFINTVINAHFLNQKLDWLHFGFGTMALQRENVARAIGAKMAVSFRGFDIGVYPIKNENCYQLLWKKADKIHVISDSITRLLVDNGCTNLKKIFKITPAIDTALFEVDYQSTIHTTYVITTVARLHWIKGLEYTLQALALLKHHYHINFVFQIIGEGKEKERLQYAAHKLGLQENVAFIGKIQPNQAVEYMKNTNFYIQYSMQEGFCNAVLEAQAMGKICIVSNAEGLSENVINNVTGFVVEKRNPKLLAQKIVEVINLDSIEKERIQNNAVTRVKNKFTLEQQIQKFHLFYSTV